MRFFQKKTPLALVKPAEGYAHYPEDTFEKSFDWGHYQAINNNGMTPAYSDEFNFTPTIRILKAAYAREPWINFALNAISRQFMKSNMVLNLKTSDDGDVQTIYRHPILDFLSSAGKENKAFFASNNIIDMMATGNAYVWLAPMLDDKKRLPAERVDIRFDKGQIQSYIITDNCGDITGSGDALLTLPPDEVLHFKMPNPYSPHFGLSPMIAINLPTLIDKYSREYIIGFFLRGGHTAGIIETDQTNADQLTRFAKTIMTAIGGRRNAHGDKILPKGAKWAAQGSKFSDMQLTEIIKGNETMFRAATGVTDIVLGLSGGSNRATAKAEMEHFWKMTILPLQDIYCAAIMSSSLKRRFQLDDRYTLAFDNSHIEYLDDWDLKLEADAKLKAVAPVNERRERLGLDPIARLGDKFEVEMTPQAKPLGASMPGDGTDPNAPAGTEQAVTAPTISLNGAQVTSLLEIVNQIAAREIPRDTGVELIMAAFALSREDADRIVGEVGRTFFAANPGDTAPPAAPPPAPEKAVDPAPSPLVFLANVKTEIGDNQKPSDRVDNYFQREFGRWEDITLANVGDLSKALELIKARKKVFCDGLVDLLMPGMMKAYDYNIARIKKTKSFRGLQKKDSDDRNAKLEGLKERGKRVLSGVAFKNAEESFDGYSESNMQRIHEFIANELNSDANMDDVAVAVRKKFGEFYEGQAKTIVSNEYSAAVASANQQFGNDLATIAKRTTKTWIAVDDQFTRDDHMSLDGKSITGDSKDVPDMPFEVNGKSYLRYPKDENGEPEDVINCRCDIIWDVEEFTE